MTTTSKGYGDYVVFVESKALRGRSKQEYLRQVRKLGEHYAGRELAGVTEREVFDYLVHRREVEKLRPSTLNQAVVALRMFYRDYLASSGRFGSASRSGAIIRCRWCLHAGRPGGYWAAYLAGGFAQCSHSSTIAGCGWARRSP